MIGLLATGSMGFGWLAVIGRSRVPSPPAITTAFTAPPQTPSPTMLSSCRLSGPRVTGSRPPHPLGPAAPAGEQSPGLYYVQQGRAPVEGGSPDSKAPTGYPRSLRVLGNVRTEEKQR